MKKETSRIISHPWGTTTGNLYKFLMKKAAVNAYFY